MFNKPSRQQVIRDLRERVAFLGSIAREFGSMRGRLMEIRQELLRRRILHQRDNDDRGLDEMAGDVGRELDRAKVALFDCGEDHVHQCSAGMRGFVLLKAGENCPQCGAIQAVPEDGGAARRPGEAEA